MEEPYEVIKITPHLQVKEEGGFINVYRILIKTKGGVNLPIELEEKDFTPEKAAPILLKAAQNADKILSL